MAIIKQSELGMTTGSDAELSVSTLPAFAPKAAPAPAAPKPAGPSTLDVFTAAFQAHNSASAAYGYLTNQYDGDKTFDRNFSPRRKAVEDGLGAYADEFTNAMNISHYEHIKSRVLEQKRAQETIDNAGGMGVGAVLTAAVLDPVSIATMFIPGLGEARIAQIGSTVGRVAARGATYTAAGLTTAVAQESVLNTLRPNTDEHSVANMYGPTGDGTRMAAAAGMGLALFGAAGRAASKATKTQVAKALDQLLVDPAGALLPANATAAQKATATAVNDASSKLYENAGTKVLDYVVSKPIGGLLDGIGLKLARSPFDAFRKWGQQIAPDIMQREATKAGVATPILNAKMMAMMESNSDIHSIGNAIIEAKKGLDGLKQLTPAEQTELLKQFQTLGLGAKTIDDITPAAVQAHVNELVGYAVATGQKHVINEIETVAQKMRSIYQKDWQRIVAQGLDAGAAGPMPAYFTRAFNKAGVAASQLQWVQAVAPHIEQSLRAAGVAAADAAKQAETVAVAAANRITGAGVAGTGADLYHAMTSAGPMGKLAARTLDVPYEVLAPFLENDAYKVMNIYKRSVEPQLALKEVFGHTTFDDFRDTVMVAERDRVKAALMESAKTAQGADLAKIQAELNGFDAAWKDGEDQLRTLFDGLMGRTKMAEKAHTDLAAAARITRKSVGMAMLSGQVISSLVDIPRQVGTHGLVPVMKAWGNYLSSSAFRSMGKETAERVGVALELTNHRLKAYAEEGMAGFERDIVGHVQGTYERNVDKLAENFQWLNGAKLWNDSLRTTTALLAEDRLLKAAEKGWTNLSKIDREWMLVLGIDEQALNGIGAAAKGATQKTRGFMHTDIDQWADLDAVRNFKLAVLKDAQTTALTPFQGTLPAWYDSEAGKFLWQFKSFISASYQQTLMVGLQRADARTFMGLTAMVATGMAIAEIKDNFSAGETKKDKTLTERVLAGVDRSGAFDAPLALAGYVNALSGSLTGHSFSPLDQNNRRTRGIADMLMGPTGTVAEQLGKAGQEITKNGFTEKAQQQIGSVTPYHKILGVDVLRAIIESIHGHTKYIDKVTGAWKETFSDMTDGE